jgi:hypothetical protein
MRAPNAASPDSAPAARPEVESSRPPALLKPLKTIGGSLAGLFYAVAVHNYSRFVPLNGSIGASSLEPLHIRRITMQCAGPPEIGLPALVLEWLKAIFGVWRELYRNVTAILGVVASFRL